MRPSGSGLQAADGKLDDGFSAGLPHFGTFLCGNFTIEQDKISRHFSARAVIDVPTIAKVDLAPLVRIGLHLWCADIPKEVLVHQGRTEIFRVDQSKNV